jgi:predicted Zn-dependent protease
MADAARIYMDVAERATDHLDARLHLGYILAMAGELDRAEKYAAEADKLTTDNAELLVLKAAIALGRNQPDDAAQLADAALRIDPRSLHALVVRGAERLKAADAKAALGFLDRGTKIDDRDLGLQTLRIKALDLLKDRPGVEATLVKLVAYYPKDKTFASALVNFYFAAGRKDEAEKALRTFTAANPDDADAELVLVRFLAKAKGSEPARAELQAKIDKGGKAVVFKQALADLWLADGKRDAAIDAMRKVIADAGDSPDSGSAKVHLARMVAANDPTEAGKLVDSVIAADPKNIEALVVRASLRAAAGHVPDAIDDLRLALHQQPDSPAILALLAEAYERNGAVALAEDQLVRAYTVAPSSETGLNYVGFLLRYGRVDPAERVLTELRAKEPNSRAVLSALAQFKLNKRDWAGAEEVADALRKLGDKEDESAADRILAASLSGEGKFEESLNLLKSSDNRADQAASVLAIVRNYISAGKTDQAEQLLKSILATRPGDAQAELLLGSVYEAANRWGEAEAAFKSVVTADAKNAMAYTALAELYNKNSRLADAERILRDGLARTNNDPSLKLALAGILDVSGQHEAAIAQYEDLYAADTQSPIVANNLASLLSQYRTDKASIDKAFAIAARFKGSNIPQFLDTLGWTYYLEGQYSEAMNLLKSAADRLPQTAAVQYHLGMAYKELGRNDLALIKLKEAIAIVPPPEAGDLARARAALDQLVSAASDQPTAAQ